MTRTMTRARLPSILLVLWLLPTPGLAQFTDPPRPPDPELQGRIEAAQSWQPQLLAEAVGRVAPQRPGVRDLYFAGFAGFGDQDVFRKEVERVRELFDARFGTDGRSLMLINHAGTLFKHPLATAANLRAALAGLAARFDPEEDVLVLFLSSHGIPRRGIVAQLNRQEFAPVTPHLLSRALSDAGIRWHVLVVSACFSGQFVPAVAGPRSLVITASAADRMSFGCTTEAEWTWFGEAFFVEAMGKLGRFVPAFEHARDTIAAREKREKIQPSQPQMSAGPEILKVLRELKLH